MRSIAIALALLCFTAAPSWAQAVWDCVGLDCQNLVARTGDTFDATNANSSIPGPVESSAPTCATEGQVYFDSVDHFLHCCDGSSWAQCGTVTTDTNAGTICSAGEFLNGDTTCDPVVVDTGPSPDCSGTLTYQDGDAGCDTYTLSGSTAELATVVSKTSGMCAEWDASGNLVADAAACNSGGGGSPGFDTITNGTNTAATAMVVGNTATLSPSGTGTITANRTACAATTEFMGGGTSAPTCYAETLYPRLLGRSGGQTLIGDKDASGNLLLESTEHATKGYVVVKTGSDFALQGTSFTTVLAKVQPTANRTITFPDASGTVSLDPVLETVECDGSADNSEIQTAINSANSAGGGLVAIVGNGTACDIDGDIEPKSNVQIRCMDLAELKADTTLTTGVFHTGDNIDNFSIRGCYINLDQQTKRAISFGADSTSFAIEDNLIEWNGDNDTPAVAPSGAIAFIRGGVASATVGVPGSFISRNRINGSDDSNDTCIQSLGAGYDFFSILLGSNFSINENTLIACDVGIEANVSTVATLNANTFFGCETACIEGTWQQSNITANNITTDSVLASAGGDAISCTGCNNMFLVGNNIMVSTAPAGRVAFIGGGVNHGGIYVSGNYMANGFEATQTGDARTGHFEVVNNVFAETTESMLVIDSPDDLMISNNQFLGNFGTSAFNGIELDCVQTDETCGNVIITGNVIEVQDADVGGQGSCIEINDTGASGWEQILISDNICGSRGGSLAITECVDINNSPSVWTGVAINSNIFDTCVTEVANDPGGTTLCGNRPVSIDTCGGGHATGSFRCVGDGLFDTVNNHSCMGTNATYTSVDWIPRESLTVDRFYCMALSDAVCNAQLQLAKNGTAITGTCTLAGLTHCAVTGLSTQFTTSDSMTIKATGGSANCATRLDCVIEFDYD